MAARSNEPTTNSRQRHMAGLADLATLNAMTVAQLRELLREHNLPGKRLTHQLVSVAFENNLLHGGPAPSTSKSISKSKSPKKSSTSSPRIPDLPEVPPPRIRSDPQNPRDAASTGGSVASR